MCPHDYGPFVTLSIGCNGLLKIDNEKPSLRFVDGCSDNYSPLAMVDETSKQYKSIKLCTRQGESRGLESKLLSCCQHFRAKITFVVGGFVWPGEEGNDITRLVA